MTDETTSGADLVADALADLSELLPLLQLLLPEQISDPTVGTTTHRRHAVGSPAPWHAEAAAAFLDTHEGLRRMETSMRRDLTGRLGQRRGGSDSSTLAAISSIKRLAYGLPDDRARYYARILNIWIAHARTMRDIDQAPEWTVIRAPRGGLPPQCPYCRTYSLRVAQESGAVRCANPRCVDAHGQRPAGRVEYGQFGHAMLLFQDGRQITHYTRDAS